MAGKSDRERIDEAINASYDKRKLAIPRVYLDMLKADMNASILLAQLVYWSDKGKRKDGLFYKSMTELTEETTLTPYKLNRAKDKLIERGLASVEVRRANGSPINHWRLNTNRIIEEISKQTTTKKLNSDCQETYESTTKKLSNPLPRKLVIHCEETYESTTKKLGNHEHKNTTKSTTEDYNTHSHKEGGSEREEQLIAFDRLWQAYEKKEDRARAFEAFKDLKPNDELLEQMIKAVNHQNDLNHWKTEEENGRYIPLLANWIRGKRWEDEVAMNSKSKKGRRISYERKYSKDQISNLFTPIRTTEELEALNAQNIEGEQQ